MKAQTTGRVLITGAPFAEIDKTPLQLLASRGIPYSLNPYGRRLSEQELLALIPPQEVLIASTEPITERVLDAGVNLRLISRVGIGLDNVPLDAAKRRGIAVTYTPDAPTPTVAELAITQMLTLLRHTAAADRGMRQGVWRRRIGRSLSHVTIGVIGAGRVGRAVIWNLKPWHPVRLLAHDLKRDEAFSREAGCQWTGPETIYREADIITLHVPLTPATRGMIGAEQIRMMKDDAILVNTSRGGVVDEAALAIALRTRPHFSAAVDVFEEEPYTGELALLDNCLVSCHMGAATRDCRLRMETEATEEVLRYFEGRPFLNPIPQYEYDLQV
jgi:D-3-phosphoglycerate dehydrogenase